MSRAITHLAAFLALYCAAAWMFVLPPFNAAPTFYENVPADGQSYTCNGGVGPSIFIRFEERGNIALVRAGGYNLRLTYKTSNSMDDVYESGQWRLTLDPEANLIGPRSVRFANCY